MVKRVVSCVYLSLALSSCTVIGPDFKAPEPPAKTEWANIQEAGIKAAPSDLKDWWKGFNDPILDSLIARAYGQNLTLQTAGLRVYEAKARLAQQVGALYPTQSLNGDFLYSRDSEYVPGQSFGNSLTQNSLGFSANWEIDFWGKIRRGIESADAQLLSSAAAYDAAMVTILGQVAESYIVIRTLEERIRLTRENIIVQRKSMELAKARFNAGATSERDYQQALTQLHDTEAILPTLEKELIQAGNTLSLLLGEMPGAVDQYLNAKSEIPMIPVNIVIGIPNEMLRRRPDIKAAEYTAAAESAAIGLTKGELYPSFSLTGSFGFSASDSGSNSLSDIFKWGAHDGNIGPFFSWNILNYGQITNAVRAQDARFQQSLSDYRDVVLRAHREVQDALTDFIKSKEEQEYREKAVKAAKRTAMLALLQYEGGATDYTTVTNAQQGLLGEQDALALAKGSVPQALVATYRALGGGWEYREGRDFVSDELKEEMKKRTDWGNLLESGDMSDSPSRSRPSW